MACETCSRHSFLLMFLGGRPTTATFKRVAVKFFHFFHSEEQILLLQRAVVKFVHLAITAT